MFKSRKGLYAALLLLFLSALTGCGSNALQSDSSQDDNAQTSDVSYTIGVAVFDSDNAEMRMFINYYRNYLEEGFPVKFIFSDSLSSAEDENTFIRSIKEQGGDAIISFYGLDLAGTMKVCEEEQMYYVLGSGTISDEVFQSVSDNPWFLGTVGPTADEEYQAGVNMVKDLSSTEKNNYLILTGGSADSNYMHLSRVQGMLETLKAIDGFAGEDVDQLLQFHENQTITSEDGINTITLCPGYMESEEGIKNLTSVLEEQDYDIVMSAFGISNVSDQIFEKEKKQGKNMKIGVVDCFSEENARAFAEEDPYGNSKLDYVEGKYASMTGPAFAIVYNALTEHKEANSADGKAVRLYQGFWSASDKEQYQELYDYTQGIYENAFDCTSLMGVIKAYTEETTPEKLKELAEAYSVEDVKNRIQALNQ